MKFNKRPRRLLDHLRYRHSQNATWDAFRHVMNKLKRAIRVAREQFISKALYSKKRKDVLKVIHRILEPSQTPIRHNPDFFSQILSANIRKNSGYK